MTRLPGGWNVPELCRQIFAVTDGFWLFGTKSWDGFRFWGSAEFDEFGTGDPILVQAVQKGLFPICGEVPHLTSVRISDGSVVSTDWEAYQQPDQGWGKVIAPSLPDFLRALIQVREAYGNDDDQPADWWHPYSMHGTRFDLGE